MNYTPQITEKLVKDYVELNRSVDDIAAELDIQKRSVIAKLSSLGVYRRKQYRDKRGEIPIKKSEYIDSIAKTLNLTPDELESLEKVNKRILQIIDTKLKPDPKPDQKDK